MGVTIEHNKITFDLTKYHVEITHTNQFVITEVMTAEQEAELEIALAPDDARSYVDNSNNSIFNIGGFL